MKFSMSISFPDTGHQYSAGIMEDAGVTKEHLENVIKSIPGSDYFTMELESGVILSFGPELLKKSIITLEIFE